MIFSETPMALLKDEKSPEEVSINLSHYNAWMRVADSCLDYGLIMEDDVEVHKDFIKEILTLGSKFMIIQSLRIICQLPDNTRILPGHGEETSIGQELAENPYLDR